MQIRRLSVKSITNAAIFDALNHPTQNGLYDPALGPIDKAGRCATCGLGAFECPGHFGHIELAVPVYAPLTFAQMYQLLKQCCFYCHRFRVGPLKTALCMLKLQLLDAGLLMEAKELENVLHHKDTVEEEDHGRTQVEPLRAKLRSFTNQHLALAKDAGYRRGRPSKSAAVAEYRAKVILDFLKSASTVSTMCQHCRGYIPALYRHAGTKIFVNPLRKNLQAMMDAKGMDAGRVFETFTTTQNGNNADDDSDDLSKRPEEESTKGMKFLTPMHVYEHLRRLWEREGQLCRLMFGSQVSSHHAEPVDHRIFFSEVLSVPPSRFRPPSVFGGSQFDHPQNTYLVEIIKLNERLLELQRTSGGKGKNINEKLKDRDVGGNPAFADLIKTWISLQEQVNFLFDSSRNNATSGKIAPPGIKQILEKKEGLFRKHMMGKRVNYAARSVISPDPNIETSEIGVPMVFATRLTYPEPVTAYNVSTLRQAVINGPEQHPGAAYVQMEDGTLANLATMNESARVALANQLRTPSTSTLIAGSGQSGLVDQPIGGGKRVLRHIRDGDVVLMNRQPTLHKPSIMAHRVRVLPGEKTLRMHYANCNTYNADFDGDEMNMHFPQSELGRAEAYGICNTNNQYLVPTDGSPLRGLIQDHVVSGVILTLKDTWLTQETYQQLLYGALPSGDAKVLTIPPAIIRPQPLWSGKQLVTTVLLNLAKGRPPINLTSGCKINARMWGPSHAMEATVIVQDGYFATGIIDKSQFGASAYGITHAVYELYGPDAAGSLLTIIGRLLTRFDQYIGFTCRMDDLLLDSAANVRRRKLIDESHAIGRQVVGDYSKVSDVDDRKAVKSAMERILRSDELMRGLDGVMKVKMNEMTSRIIETCLPEGQLRLFPLNNMSLMTLSGAKGSMVNFSQIAGLLGQQELEGRRVPTMVSGKTHPSFPPFDPRARAGGYITQRFLTGIRPQEFFFHCMAGREGLIDTAVKTSRSGYLQRCLVKHLESLKVNYDNTVRDSDGSILQFHYGEDGLDVIKQKYLRNFSFAARNFDTLAVQCQPALALERVNTEAAVKAARKVAKKPSKYEPVLAKFSPNVFLGATSERFASEMEKFLASEEGKAVPEPANFRAVMWLRYMRALVEPGEAVGLLAAQSIGEPSTQMTLNTFHFAGFGAKNVTLGIPRLREIIMTASKVIKTPSITVPLAGRVEPTAETLCKRMSKLTLKQLVADVCVTERLVDATSVSAAVNLGKRARVYSVLISLIPMAECIESHSISASEIQAAMEGPFVRVLLAAIDKTLKRQRGAKGGSVGDLITSGKIMEKVSTGHVEEGSEEKESHKARGDMNSDSEDDDGDIEDVDEEGADAKAELRRQGERQEADEDDDEHESSPLASDMETDEVSETYVVATASKESLLGQTRTIRNYTYDQRHNTITLDLVYPASHPKLLLLDILERHVGDVIVRQIPGIARVFPHRDDSAPINSPPTGITTEGANLRGLWEHPASAYLDLRHLLSNDVHAILTHYGVEAARATIVREIAAVFAVYGISVDHRHLAIIADYMTAGGGYRPFNRMGMSSAPSPLLQMTFETTVGFLRQAALMGDWDELRSPSARIVMGLPVELGTGTCELRQPITSQ
jgi:DNA-directed RNA polymerase I subunit RPA1